MDQLERREDEEQQHEENGNPGALEAVDNVDDDMFQLADAEEDAERTKAKLDQCEAWVSQKREALARFCRECEAEVKHIKAVMEEHVGHLERKLEGEIQAALDETVKAKIEHNHRDKHRVRYCRCCSSPGPAKRSTSCPPSPLALWCPRCGVSIDSCGHAFFQMPSEAHLSLPERTVLSPWHSGCEHGQPSNQSLALRDLDGLQTFGHQRTAPAPTLRSGASHSPSSTGAENFVWGHPTLASKAVEPQWTTAS
ncbi:unnamed protein product [Ectocarpus fasciculatus]